MGILLIVIAALVAIAAFKGIKIVDENHRLVIYRLGKLVGVRGPGLLLIVPFIDKGLRLNLDHAIPGWQGLPEQQLNDRIIAVISGTPASWWNQNNQVG